ncbi:MAG: CBS domain-containing protein [Thermoproteota archaeon]
MITRSDILQVPLEQRNKKTVGSAMSGSLVVTYPEEDLEAVFMKMLRNQIGRLPVVEPENPRKLVGIITREDIMHAYKAENLSEFE